MSAIAIAEVDGMTRDAFVAAFGDIAEASLWVAEEAEPARPFGSREAMVAAFHAAIDDASPERQMTLLQAHPDLAGRAAIAGDLLPESRAEQVGAGLDRLTTDEFARFTELNDRYRARFDFPFILAVKGATKDVILASFETRIGNTVDEEIATALAQVKRIVRFRLQDRVAG